MSLHVNLSRLAPHDASWLFATYRDCMRVYVEPEYGWDETRQRDGLAGSVGQGVWRILSLDGVRCGFVHWENSRADISLKLLCINSAMQQRGIGSAVLGRLEQYSRLSGKPLHLKALTSNLIAYDWYLRRGFVEVARDVHTRSLVWHA